MGGMTLSSSGADPASAGHVLGSTYSAARTLGQSIMLVKIWPGSRELVQARDIHRSRGEMCKSLVWVLGLCLSRFPFSAVIMTMSCAGITQGEQQLSQTVRGKKNTELVGNPTFELWRPRGHRRRGSRK